MKAKDIFEVCPICHGSMEVLNYNPDMIGTTNMKTEECVHCYFGIVIKNKAYKKIAKSLNIPFNEVKI